MRRGIDISKWQGKIDFNKVKADGVEFVILREGYRRSIDPKFHEYVRQCKEAGLPIEAVYHFCYALSSRQSQEEAKACIANVEAAGLSKDTIIFFDFEYDTVDDAKKKGVNLTKADCNDFTTVFCEYVKSQGYRAGIYLNNDYHKNWYNKTTLNNRVIWLADYTNGPDHECQYQQYSSKGRVAGISGNVDMNYAFDVNLQPSSPESSTMVSPSNDKTIIKMGQIHANNFIGFTACESNGIRDEKTKIAGAMVLQTAMNLDYKAGLKIDGDIGPKSKAALKGHYVQYGETQYMVTALEILLMLNGIQSGLELPGIYGELLKQKLGNRCDENKFIELIK